MYSIYVYIYIYRERTVTGPCGLLLRILNQTLKALLEAAEQVDSGLK